MDIDLFESKLRLGAPFTDKWGIPSLTDVQIDMFRKRSKPLTWRPISDPHIFFFYDDDRFLRDAFEQLSKNSEKMPESLKVYFYSGKRTSVFTAAREELRNDSVQIYPFGLPLLLDDIEALRVERESLRIEHGEWVLPSVGVTLFVIDLDSFPFEEIEEVFRSGILEHLLFDADRERVFLMLVSKNVENVPADILPLVEFGLFLGDSARFVEPYANDDTYWVRPLAFRDSRGKFWQAGSNNIGDLYDRKYSFNQLGNEVFARREKEQQDFVDWVESFDDGTDD